MVKKLKPGKCGQTARLIGTNFGALMQIHLERVVGPKKLAGGGIGGGGSEIQKSEKAHVNTHMHINLQRVVSQLGGGGQWGGGGRGSEIKKSEKAHVNTHTHMHIHLQRVVGQIKISPV